MDIRQERDWSRNMIIGIGTDIVKIDRFVHVNEQFLARVYTQQEQAYIQAKNHATAAGLFAAKEAVAKALGTGFNGFWPCDIEVTHNDKGHPAVLLHNKAEAVAMQLAAAAGNDRHSINLSISHSDSDAVAFAIIEALTQK